MLQVSSSRYAGTDFVTGMRAFAALGVILVHTGGAGLAAAGGAWSQLVSFGATGVFAFFVISGFSISSSFAKHGLEQYLVARISRIVPLYFFWLAICVALQGGPAAVGLYSILMHVTFLSPLDARVSNSIIMVEWTIAIEMFYYLILPAFVLFATSPKRLLVLTVMSFAVYRAAWFLMGMPDENGTDGLTLFFSPFPYATSFVMGIAAYRMRSWYRAPDALANLVFVAVIIVVWVFLSYPEELLIGHQWVRISVVSCATFALITFGSDRALLFDWLLRNRAIQFLGLISYGLYLSHFPIMLWLVKPNVTEPLHLFLWTLALSVGVSSATYFLIEKPSKAFGRRLAPAI